MYAADRELCGVDLSDIPEGVRVVSGFVRAVKPGA